MPNRNRNGLALVARGVPGGPAGETGSAAGLSGRIEEILREQFPVGDDVARSRPPTGQSVTGRMIPFCIRLTIEQLLKTAEDADLRAQMLEWSAREMPSAADALRKVNCLREVAFDLRHMTAQLNKRWQREAESL